MRNLVLAASASAAFVAMTAPAHAWGPSGHRVVGQIAADNVSGRTAAEIALILDDGETLAEASTWPDEQRSDPAAFWQKEAGAYHYVTLPDGKSYAEAGTPPQGDAISALARFTKVLKDDKASREDKALALRFVVHIVGDLHQPLHNGSGKDRGGNEFQVTYFGRSTNLHTVWDRELVASSDYSFSELAALLESRLTDKQKIAWWNADPLMWVGESVVIRDTIYPPADNRELGYEYVWKNWPIIEQRLTQGGIRLAAYLDATFAE
ncbi:S1/P1 Nuclease [Croceicoccus ponticola]|uniref:S1/P1 Nuclease n=1 Tax=Croceicoccus ponticola TaxID=2217664 RepID=A0A437GVT8_9SPHN|nr:S1/P1 nuclease [Croceicoccus ponticola]RVQ65995.1 S1/P1 Nuclease [Croceicoccus ponticola]